MAFEFHATLAATGLGGSRRRFAGRVGYEPMRMERIWRWRGWEAANAVARAAAGATSQGPLNPLPSMLPDHHAAINMPTGVPQNREHDDDSEKGRQGAEDKPQDHHSAPGEHEERVARHGLDGH